MTSLIWIKEQTKDVLTKMKIHPRESYSSVVERLLEAQNEATQS
jgi:predicted CopG family antitoxin